MNIRLLILLLFSTSIVLAQGNSPLSQYGIGVLNANHFQSSFGLDQASSSYRSKYFLNPSNPASYSHLKITVGELGVLYANNQYYSGTKSNSKNAFNLGNFGFGFPLSANSGVAIGLQPYTQKDYNYRFQEAGSTGDVFTRKFRGDGNVSQLFIGGGYQLKQFSFGLNFNYYFGELRDVEQLEFDNNELASIRHQTFNLIRTANLQLGMQYDIPVKEEHFITLSGTFGSENFFNRTTSYEVINNYKTILTENDGDTILVELHGDGIELLNTENEKTSTDLQLPFDYTAGIAYTKSDKLFLSLNYSNKAWDSFRLGTSGGLQRSQTLSFGAQIVPNNNAKGSENYWKSIVYRFGGHFGTSPYLWQGNQLNEAGIKFGFGFPLTKYKYESERFGSYLFTSFGYDRMFNPGSPGEFTQNLFKINFAIILNDKWFIQRKFD